MSGVISTIAYLLSRYMTGYISGNNQKIVFSERRLALLKWYFCALIDCNKPVMTALFEYSGSLACTRLVMMTMMMTMMMMLMMTLVFSFIDVVPRPKRIIHIKCTRHTQFCAPTKALKE